MSETFQLFAVFAFFFVMLVLLPLCPAILIYLLNPTTIVEANGPFRGLLINVKGAFAAYFLVLLILIAPVGFATDIIRRQIALPTWELDAPIMIQDRDGELRQPNLNLAQLDVKVNPLFQVQTGNHLILDCFRKQSTGRWPAITLTAGDYVGKLALNGKEQSIDIDRSHNRLSLRNPIILREISKETTPDE